MSLPPLAAEVLDFWFPPDVNGERREWFQKDPAFDRELGPCERGFMYMPFEHSESLPAQERSVALFAALASETGADGPLPWAERHRDVVRRFGRFPHRNEILGRESTPEEIEFLEEPGSRF